MLKNILAISTVLFLNLFNQATANQVKVGMSVHLPPFITVRDLGMGKGIEAELLEGVFKELKWQHKEAFMASKNLAPSLNRRAIDAVVMIDAISLKEKVKHTIYKSDPLTAFENVAISFKKT